MKEKFKAYYHKFINYLKSNWVKVLCIFIVIVYFVCGIVSIYKNGSSSDDPLNRDSSLPITSTYKVINRKQAIQSDEANVTIGENEFTHTMLEFPSSEDCRMIRSFDNTSFNVLTNSVSGVFKFSINFKASQKKFITFNWHNPDQLLIKFYYNDVVISELDEFIIDYSYNFYFSSNGNENEISSLVCSVTPSYQDRDDTFPTVSFWNIGIYDLNPYFDYAYNLGNDFGYDNGYTSGFDEGEKSGDKAGYDRGYEVGYREGYDQGDLVGGDEGYQRGFNEGKAEGLHEGERKGYDEGLVKGREVGYKNGYDEGYSAGSSVVQVKDVFIDILEAPFNIIKNAFNFEILGINFSSILVGIVSILLVGFVIKKVI